MPQPLTAYRVFIGSPNGLDSERTIIRDVIRSYNESDALQRGVQFIPVEGHTVLGGVGPPQFLINSEILRADYSLFILSDRWGTAPHPRNQPESTSGTLAEF